MADKKISALTAASTPLAGTEVLPIVQGGSTVKVSVNNLTTGKPVTVSRLLADGAYDAAAPSTSSVPIVRVNEGGAVSLWISGRGYTNMWMQAIQDDGSNNLKELLLQPLGGPVTIGDGNLIVGTAGRGIDFSANGGDVLSQYDEGTWAVVWTNLTGTPSNTTGHYTRVGRMVFFTYAAGANSISGVGDVAKFTLPFTPGGYAAGSMISQTNTNSGSILIDTGAVAYPNTFSASFMVFSGVFYI